MKTEKIILSEEQALILEQLGIRSDEHLMALMDDSETLLRLFEQLSFSPEQLEQISYIKRSSIFSGLGFIELPIMGLIEEKGDE